MINGIFDTIFDNDSNCLVLCIPADDTNLDNGKNERSGKEDITDTLSSVSLMFLVDLVSGIFIGVILKILFSINLLKTCGEMVQKFWPLMAIKIAAVASRVTYRFMI